MSTQTAAADDTLSYTYRPSLLGAPWAFTLTGDAIAWVAGSKSGRVALSQVKRVRMSYRPVNMQSYRFVTEIWAEGAPKLQIASVSWKSMVQQERLDESYAGFVGELHRRIAQSRAPAVFLGGTNPVIFWLGFVVFAGVCLGLAALIVRGLATDAKAGAAFVAAFLALFLWQGGNFLRRNRPGRYRPDALPALLMPRG